MTKIEQHKKKDRNFFIRSYDEYKHIGALKWIKVLCFSTKLGLDYRLKWLFYQSFEKRYSNRINRIAYFWVSLIWFFLCIGFVQLIWNLFSITILRVIVGEPYIAMTFLIFFMYSIWMNTFLPSYVFMCIKWILMKVIVNPWQMMIRWLQK